jgi:hypothetical protein
MLMPSYSRQPTLSQALLSLGRIRSIENSISQGLSAFYRVRGCITKSEEESNDVKLDLRRFKEFCNHFTKIVAAENQEFRSIEAWLIEKPQDELTSRVDTFLVVYSLFPEKENREKWRVEIESLGKIAEATLRGQCDPDKINEALEKLLNLRSEFKRKLETEKKTSEKVLSGRAPFI